MPKIIMPDIDRLVVDEAFVGKAMVMKRLELELEEEQQGF